MLKCYQSIFKQLFLNVMALKLPAQDGPSNNFNGVTLNGVLLATTWSKWCELQGLQSQIFIPAHGTHWHIPSSIPSIRHLKRHKDSINSQFRIFPVQFTNQCNADDISRSTHSGDVSRFFSLAQQQFSWDAIHWFGFLGRCYLGIIMINTWPINVICAETVR